MGNTVQLKLRIPIKLDEWLREKAKEYPYTRTLYSSRGTTSRGTRQDVVYRMIQLEYLEDMKRKQPDGKVEK